MACAGRVLSGAMWMGSMLTFHSTAAKGKIEVGLDAQALPPGVNWVDAMQPNEAEVAFLRRALGVAVPSLESLSEIETSSRLYRRNGHLVVSMPMLVARAGGLAQTTPLGFVLGRDFVLTVRYERMRACDDLLSSDDCESERPASGPGAWIALLERIIDNSADELEKINAELDTLSRAIFDQGTEGKRSPIRDNMEMRRVLGAIAGSGYLAAKNDDMLLGVARMLPFVSSEAASYLSAEEQAKIQSLVADVSSLKEYGRAQSERTQFLLDATLGLTNVEQNNIFRVLTVVSVIGIPPTLIASMYGMNFRNMPELGWTYGYEWGLGLILLSALIPVVWFKKRGWW
jgi:magnesium transporter